MRSNPIQFLQMFQQAKNPREMFVNMIQNNPQYQKTYNELQNSSNGASTEQMVRQLAQRQGISEEQLMQMYNSIAKR